VVGVDSKSQVASRRYHVRGIKEAVGGKKQEVGSRKQEVGKQM
jgi:hypothetical protein